MLRIEIAEKVRNYLLMFVLMIFSLMVMMVPVAMSTEFSGFREVLQYFALILIVLFGSSLFTSNAISQYASQASGMSALMLPASALEKFLASLLLNLLFLVPVLCVFWWLHYYTLDIANAKLVNQDSKYHPVTADIVNYTSFGYFGIQACVFLGSIFFRKGAYIKTAAIAVGLAFVTTVINVMFVSSMTQNPSKLTALPLSGWKLWYFEEIGAPRWNFASFYYEFPLNNSLLLMTQLVTVAFIMALWACAFFQLKERQI